MSFGLLKSLGPNDPIPRWWLGEEMTDNDTEIEALRRKLEARKDMPGYEENRREIEARIAELEAASR